MTKQLQKLFQENLFCKNKDLDFIKSEHAFARFAIYENTVISGLIRSLKFTYPGIWQLLGEKCAKAMARRFLDITSERPTTGCLDDWGVTFAKFLRKQPELKSIKYLEDYARFEWFCFRAKIGVVEQAILHNSFLNYDEDELLNLRLVFNSNLAVMKSEYNLQQIYKFLHTNRESENTSLILSSKRSYVLITKQQQNIRILWPNAELWQFIFYLHQGYTLGKAIELIEQLTKSFDLVAALNFMLSNDLITEVELLA